MPEVRGWGSQLAWSLAGFDAVHAHLSAVVSRSESADEVIAAMALYNGVDELPAALAAAAGGERFVRINDQLDRRRQAMRIVEGSATTPEEVRTLLRSDLPDQPPPDRPGTSTGLYL